MPVPTLISSLDPVAGNNSPAASETPKDGDDYLRALSAFVAQLYDGSTSVSAGMLKSNGTSIAAATADVDYQSALTAASQAEMEAGTETNLRSMSPLRVKQAIAALTPVDGLHSLGQVVINSDTTLGATQDGRNIVVTASCTLTLPSAAYTYAIQATGTATVTLSYPTGSDFRTTLLAGESVILCGDGLGYWRSYCGTTSLGVGQSWQDVTGSRTAGTTHYNTTGRPIMVAVYGVVNNGIGSAYVDGIQIWQQTTTNINWSNFYGISFVVPDGGSYSATFQGSFSWKELR